MNEIINLIKTRKKINQFLNKDENIWSNIEPQFSLGIPTRDNEKISKKFLKTYYYDCYEPARENLYGHKKNLTSGQEHNIALFANIIFINNYADYFLYSSPNVTKAIILALGSLTQSSISFSLDNNLSVIPSSSAILTASIGAYFVHKHLKQYSKYATQADTINRSLMTNDVNLKYSCDKVYKITHNIEKKQEIILDKKI